MNVQRIDQEYNQLQQETAQVTQALQSLATKLQIVSQTGDQNAREWLLDLKELALTIRNEQQQVLTLMQTMHLAVQNDQQYAQSDQQGYAAQGQSEHGNTQDRGFLSEFASSGFGRALEMGAGFGIGDGIISSLF
jgi:uncharacterized protein YhaN